MTTFNELLAPVTPIIQQIEHDRPKHHNAFTEVMVDELVRVFTMFDVDDRVRCVVLSGAGKMFCAGADLNIGFNKAGVPEEEQRDGCVK